jgi:hypothetical protein
MGSELLLLRESIVVERSRCIEMVIVSRKKHGTAGCQGKSGPRQEEGEEAR